MATSDFEAFLIERLQALNITQDLSPGSPADTLVIQPTLRRLGTDPFTVDIGLFLQTRINQAFPELATREGDALTDLLIKMDVLLWEPITREIARVKRNLSLKDPETLTIEEAEALGANLFSPRTTGNFSKGVGRIYFSQPQGISVSPENFFTAKGGFHYIPTDEQSIRVEEMLLNLEGSLYYFDVNLVAENAGDGYNIEADELVGVSGIGAAVRVTNKTRFRNGTIDETTVEYVSRLEQELTERSLVTLRGINSKITTEFAEVTSIAVTGFGDEEMQRDVLVGGGLGGILAAGLLGASLPDGENATKTRRMQFTDVGVDFNQLVSTTGAAPKGYTLTLHNAFPVGDLPIIRDLPVRAIVDTNILDLVDQALSYSATSIPWVLRKNELTVSGIPGGVLFPNTDEGNVVLPNGLVHIGGATDIFVRGAAFDLSSVLLSSVVDDFPNLQGLRLSTVTTTTVRLLDYVLAPGVGSNYSVDDAVYKALIAAKEESFSLQILDPPNAGSYRILDVTQVAGFGALITITPALTVTAGDFRWRITDLIDVDLIEPKETKIAGSDLRTVQGSNIVDTVGGVDFDAQGVGVGDVLRIVSGGNIEGDYVVQGVLGGFFTQLQVDRVLVRTVTGARYAVFRKNADGGVTPPFVRVTSIDLLDTSSQPVGATVPFASPVDVQSRGFANVARGVKSDVTDAILGLVTLPFSAGLSLSGLTLTITWPTPVTTVSVTFTGSNPKYPADVVAAINAAASTATGGVITRLAVLVDNDTRVGILPVYAGVSVTGGTSRILLFGYAETFRCTDIHSSDVFITGGWAQYRPFLDANFDVAQVLDGTQIGFYDGLTFTNPFNVSSTDTLHTNHEFNPEVRRHLQVGARSIGTARVYFLDPTSFEIGKKATFSYMSDTGAVLRFFPDPTNSYQRIPALPSASKPKDGSTGGVIPASTFSSVSTDFILKGIRSGDLLVLDYTPLVGTAILADPVPNLHGKNIVLSINGGSRKSITFVRDSPSIGVNEVTRQGVVDQINKGIGQVICDLVTVGPNQYLQFNPDASIVVVGSSAASSSNSALGFSLVTGVDQSNDGPNKGTYVIDVVAPSANPNRLQIVGTFPSGVTSELQQQYKVFRASTQRIVSTDMAKNVAPASLYFFDAQLISEGTGDQYNINADLQMVVEGYRSDGYFITVRDPNLSFSTECSPMIHFSRSILQVGVSDDPVNATQLSGQNLLINYERSSLTDNVNSFVLSETERVINESPLARHLIPHFVRFDMTYIGGSKETEVIPDIVSFIQALTPDAFLNVSDIEKLVHNRGATSVQNPIDLVAVVYNPEGTVTVQRSRDKLNTGRLAAFVPDVLNVVRRTN